MKFADVFSALVKGHNGQINKERENGYDLTEQGFLAEAAQQIKNQNVIGKDVYDRDEQVNNPPW
jgi:hypothetical protein